MNERFSNILWGFLVASVYSWIVVLMLLSGRAAAAVLISEKQAPQLVSIRDQLTTQGAVSGVLVNNSPSPIRDVQLLICDSWEWANEFRPGTVNDNPGRSIYYTVSGEILPGKSLPFSYRPTTLLPARSDGRFVTSMNVVAVTEVYSKKMRVTRAN